MREYKIYFVMMMILISLSTRETLPRKRYGKLINDPLFDSIDMINLKHSSCILQMSIIRDRSFRINVRVWLPPRGSSYKNYRELEDEKLRVWLPLRGSSYNKEIRVWFPPWGSNHNKFECDSNNMIGVRFPLRGSNRKEDMSDEGNVDITMWLPLWGWSHPTTNSSKKGHQQNDIIIDINTLIPVQVEICLAKIKRRILRLTNKNVHALNGNMMSPLDSQDLSIGEIFECMQQFKIVPMSGNKLLCGYRVIVMILAYQGIQRTVPQLQLKYKNVRLTEVECATILVNEGSRSASLFCEIKSTIVPRLHTLRYFSNRAPRSRQHIYGFYNTGSHWDLMIFGVGESSLKIDSDVQIYSFSTIDHMEKGHGDISLIYKVLDKNAELLCSVILANEDPTDIIRDLSIEQPEILVAYDAYLSSVQSDIEAISSLVSVDDEEEKVEINPLPDANQLSGSEKEKTEDEDDTSEKDDVGSESGQEDKPSMSEKQSDVDSAETDNKDVSYDSYSADQVDIGYVGEDLSRYSNMHGDCRCLAVPNFNDCLNQLNSNFKQINEVMYALASTFATFKEVNNKVWSNIFSVDECAYINLCKLMSILMLSLEIPLPSFDRDFLVLYSTLIMKFRHELVVSLFSATSSDVPFSEVFNIGSKRTPDIIQKTKNGYEIYEVTVVSDVQRGFHQKGEETGGKYMTEVRELRDQGLNIYYQNIVVKDDLSNLRTYNHLMIPKIDITQVISKVAQINGCIRELYPYISDGFIKILPDIFNNYKFKNYNQLCPNDDSNRIDNDYFRYSFDLISLKIKALFEKRWDRLLAAIKSKPDLAYRLKINSKSSAFEFIEDAEGATKSLWVSIIEKRVLALDYTDIVGSKGVRSAQDLLVSTKNLSKHLLDTGSRLKQKYTQINLLTNYNTDHVPHSRTRRVDFTPETKTSLINLNMLNPENCSTYEVEYLDRLYKMLLPEMKNTTSFEDYKSHKSRLPDFLFSSKIAVFENASAAYMNSLLLANTPEQVHNMCYKPKCSFLYPFASDFKLPSDERKRAKFYLNFRLGIYTTRALTVISELPEVRAKVDMSTNVQYCNLKRDLLHLEADRLSEITDPVTYMNSKSYKDYKSKRSGIFKKMEEVLRNTNASKSKGLKAIPMGAQMKELWLSELGHLRNTKNKTKDKKVGGTTSYTNGIFLKDSNEKVFTKEYVENQMSNLLTSMYELVSVCEYDVIDQNVGEDCSSLNALKKLYLDQSSSAYKTMKSTRCYHAAKAVSDLCLSLHYFSTTSCGNNLIMFDNFGANGFLIVRGGKKIYQNNRSRWFRIFYIVPEKMRDFCCPNSSSYTQHSHMGNTICISPWIHLHETLVTDGMFFCHKLSSFMMTAAMQSEDEPAKVYQNISLTIALGFHQRRKTEARLHQIRYVLVNAFSYYTDYQSILSDVTGPCVDLMQSCVFLSLGFNLDRYLTSVSDFVSIANSKIGEMMVNDELNICHPISGVILKSLSDFSFGVYLTALMSKAPVDNLSEQVLDLKAVLKTFTYYAKTVGSKEIKEVLNKTSTTASDNDYFEKLFSHDFMFDPKLTWVIGRFCGDYMMTKSKTSQLSAEFDRILDEPYHTIANTSGLRGRYMNKDFFGRKGYYVVFKEVDQIDMDKVSEILESEITPFEKRKKIQAMNITLITKYEEVLDEEILLHMVHKIQKGGSREIYVMNFSTKIKQQPMEKFFKVLCTLLPNEMICIPSNKRTKWLHKKMNTKEKGLDFKSVEVNHTYDCKRWAPHCNILKYYYFISGMSHILPQKFVKLFLIFWDQYWDKLLIVRGRLGDTYRKHPELAVEFENCFTPMQFEAVITKINRKTGVKTIEKKEIVNLLYKAKMTFSFMMGILNYLSSLHHAASQLYMRYAIQKISNRMRVEEKSLDFQSTASFVAHSDDSGGKSFSKNFSSLGVTTAIHEVILKAGNMMLSKKKCCVSRTFFELLSILYLAGVLIPMTPKFSGTLSISPSDNGYSDDVKTSISKCIELVTMGGNFQQAYIQLKINTSMIRYFYSLPLSPNCYNRSVAALGVPDGHPLMYMLAGTNYDSLRLKMFAEKDWAFSEKFRYILTGALGKLKPSYTTFNRYKEEFGKYDEMLAKLNLTEIETRILKDLDKSTTIGCLAQFSALKNDDKFAWSLDYESKSRRITRAKWAIVTDCIPTVYGMTSYKKLDSLYCAVHSFYMSGGTITDTEYVKKMCGDFTSVEIDEQLKKKIEAHNKTLLGFDDIKAIMRMLHRVKFRLDTILPIPATNRPTVIKLDIGLSPIGTDFSVERMMVRMFAPKLLPFMNNPHREEVQEKIMKKLIDSETIKDPDEVRDILETFKSRTKKVMYIYAQVPRLKTITEDYRGFMDLLSFNSFYCKEIRGLKVPVLNKMSLSGEMYTSIDMITYDDIMYEIYNMMRNINSTKSEPLIKLLKICGAAESRSLESYLDEVLRSEASVIAKSIAYTTKVALFSPKTGDITAIDLKELSAYCFYYFEKEQVRTSGKWWGLGTAIIYHMGERIKIDLDGDTITNLTIPYDLKHVTSLVRFIDLFCLENGYPPLTKCFRFQDDNESSIIYNHDRLSFGLGPATLDYLSFPVSHQYSVGITAMGRLYSNLNIKMGDDENVYRINICPGEALSSGSMSGNVFVKDDITKKLNDIIGFADIDLDESARRLEKGFDITPRKLITCATSSEIYRLIFESGKFPSDDYEDPKTGSLISSLFEEKERDNTYKFYPNFSYMSSFLKSAQNYSGVHLQQSYQSGKKAYEALGQKWGKVMLEEVRELINKSFEIGTSNSQSLRDTLRKWGAASTRYALTSFDEHDSGLLLESMVAAFEYMPSAVCQIIAKEELCCLYQSLVESESVVWKNNRLYRTGDDRYGMFEHLLEFLRENTRLGVRNEMNSAYFMVYQLLSFLSGTKRLREIANRNRSKIKTQSHSKIKIRKKDIQKMATLISKTIITSTTHNELEIRHEGGVDSLRKQDLVRKKDGQDDSNAAGELFFRELCQELDKIRKTFPTGIEKATREFRGTQPFPKVRCLPVWIPKMKYGPCGKITEDLNDEIEGLCGLPDDEVEDEAEALTDDIVDSYKAPNNNKILTNGEIKHFLEGLHMAGSECTSSLSNNIMVRIYGFKLPAPKARAGKIKLGFLKKEVAQKARWGNSAQLVMVAADQGLKPFKKMGLIELTNDDLPPLPTKEKTFKEITKGITMEEYEKNVAIAHQAHRKAIFGGNDPEKIKEMTETEIYAEIYRREMSIIGRELPGHTVSEMVVYILGSFKPKIVKDLVDQVEEVVKNEKDPDYIRGMTILPLHWGTIKAQAAPRPTAQILQDQKVISELRVFGHNLHLTIIDGTAEVSEAVEGLCHACTRTALILADKGPVYDDISAAVEVLYSVMKNMRVTRNGDLANNNSMSNYCKLMLEIAGENKVAPQRGRPKPVKSDIYT